MRGIHDLYLNRFFPARRSSRLPGGDVETNHRVTPASPIENTPCAKTRNCLPDDESAKRDVELVDLFMSVVTIDRGVDNIRLGIGV
jgi:hypothetical protein